MSDWTKGSFSALSALEPPPGLAGGLGKTLGTCGLAGKWLGVTEAGGASHRSQNLLRWGGLLLGRGKGISREQQAGGSQGPGRDWPRCQRGAVGLSKSWPRHRTDSSLGSGCQGKDCFRELLSEGQASLHQERGKEPADSKTLL